MTFCASKTVNGVTTNHIWDGSNIVAETDGNKQVTAKYYRGSGLISQEVSNTESYYQFNMHGDVIGLTGANGELIEDYDYDAFGNQINQSTEKSTPFRYAGEYYDEETDLIYLRNRYYSPIVGQFITEDPAKDGTNWYVYCAGDPVNLVDPSGMVITTSTADSAETLRMLQELTDDKLDFVEYLDENGNATGKGEIVILEVYDTERHVGQTLITDLINSKTEVNVNLGFDTNGESNYIEWNNLSKMTIWVDNGNTLGIGVEMMDTETGEIGWAAFDDFMVLGHEMVNAWSCLLYTSDAADE